ncbi:MAG TPA: class I SAM-dependent methyltransferase [Bacillales bacterium]|nr:class I SAM-dependent methyltransferase [Bacillales bacterium]
MNSSDVARQYKNASNLDSRISLHGKFSTNPQDWHEWLFEQLEIAPESRILELGCGSGVFWLKNRSRIPESWEVLLSDFSSGMLEDAILHLAEMDHDFAYQEIDAQSIPYPVDSFDVVIANHMLYHVPDRAKALSEIRRVLKPDGVFYASTIGKDHMKEIEEMVADFDPNIQYASFEGADDFGLESGADQLSEFFSQVQMKRFECHLKVTEVPPLVAYILSTGDIKKDGLAGERLAAFHDFLEKKMPGNGAIHITKDTGFFTAK